MGAFYVNCCVRGLDQGEVLAFLREHSRIGYAGPTVNGWTALVADDLEMQDLRTLDSYGRALTRNSDRVAIIFLCHDEDVLKVALFRAGEMVGDFDSNPSLFHDPREFDEETMEHIGPPLAEEHTRPVLNGAQAFAEVFGLDEATVHDLLPRDDHEAARRILERGGVSETFAAHLREYGLGEGPLELHQRWVTTLGLPDYSVAMGFHYVEEGESEVEWKKTPNDAVLG